jgi:hypothetical protein
MRLLELLILLLVITLPLGGLLLLVRRLGRRRR